MVIGAFKLNLNKAQLIIMIVKLLIIISYLTKTIETCTKGTFVIAL